MIQVIERFHKIILYVAVEPEKPRFIKEMAEMLGVSQPACANIIRTLVELGYLEALPDKKGYILGPTPHLIVQNSSYKKHIVMVAEPIIDNLVAIIEEMCVLVVNVNGKRVQLLEKQSDTVIQVKQRGLGFSQLYYTATGQLFLSRYSPKDLQLYIKAHGLPKNCHFDIESEEALLNKLAKIREQGFNLLHPEVIEPNSCTTMSFPIYINQKLEAALGIKVPSFRYQGDHAKKIFSESQKAAQQISALLSSSFTNI